jgi:hypothetical protein
LRAYFEKLIAEETVGFTDFQNILFTDEIDIGFEHIQAFASKNPSKLEQPQKPLWILGEHK